MRGGMRTAPEASADWEMVLAQLPEGWRELADEMHVIRKVPEHLGAKIKDVAEILRLVFHHTGMNNSLRLTTAASAAAGLVEISFVALHKWMRRLGPYLATLLQRMVGTAAFAPEKWGGFDVIAGDATTVQLPGSKGTTARVHYALRLADLSARYIQVTDEKGGETARRFDAKEGELWLLDRGYATPAGVGGLWRQEGPR